MSIRIIFVSLVVLVLAISSNACTCASSSVAVINLDVSLAGITIYEKDEKINDDRAGTPNYVYLVSEEEAVSLAGPDFSSTVGISPEDQLIQLVGDIGYRAEGYTVTVNSRLSYEIDIADFEHEMALAKVELTKEGDIVRSSFVFVGMGNGVAKDVTITAVVDGVAEGSTIPISIEARHNLSNE
ncbi:MAG: hypothetical protein HN929_01095 [Chloroflexi bacterium]|jgi:hypothetical protein|nr:hypothetical protein [Chloroflexota bacterium]MBT7080060.1 hypothetical protein [Chloroflexota bacterium]MBT7289777.1 hypothetical protein [Chloroflexota bacterium]